MCIRDQADFPVNDEMQKFNIHRRKNIIRLLFLISRKSSKLFKDLNVKPEIMKILEAKHKRVTSKYSNGQRHFTRHQEKKKKVGNSEN